MAKKMLIGFVVVSVIVAGLYLLLGAPQLGIIQAGAPEVLPTIAPVEDDNQVIVEGRVVPVSEVMLSFPTSGVVDQVLVAEGGQVKAGQVLARLNADRLHVALQEAEANLAIAEARLAEVETGPTAAEIAAAEAAVEVARTGVATAQANLDSAQAELARAQAGPRAEEIAIAEHRIAQAKNARWAAQAQRDAICGRVGKGAQSADCDSAEAAIAEREEDVLITELQLRQLKAGPRAADIAAAQGRVAQAQGGLATAEAQVHQAEAELARASMGASAEEIRVAKAQIQQAKAGVEASRAALTDVELRAPYDGTLISLDVAPGEFVTSGQAVAQVADVSRWMIETVDLSELHVVEIEPGETVIVTLDALPELELRGQVERIVELGRMERGEVVYKALVSLGESDPRLRWYMTAAVRIETEAE